MHSRVKAEIIALACQKPQEEVCGLVYADSEGLKTFPCHNVAPDPAEAFEIDHNDRVKCLQMGRLFGIYHSHPDDASFSPADLDDADYQGVPYYLYTAAGRWLDYVPETYESPLECRPFVLGEWDCYGLVRDYYRQHLKHHLSDYDRDESFCHEEQGVIMANFQKEGLELAAEPRQHDILLFRSDKVLPQHFGVYLGANRFLHHPRGGLSGVEQLSDRWLSRLVCVFRRKTATDSV